MSKSPQFFDISVYTALCNKVGQTVKSTKNGNDLFCLFFSLFSDIKNISEEIVSLVTRYKEARAELATYSEVQAPKDRHELLGEIAFNTSDQETLYTTLRMCIITTQTALEALLPTQRFDNEGLLSLLNKTPVKMYPFRVRDDIGKLYKTFEVITLNWGKGSGGIVPSGKNHGRTEDGTTTAAMTNCSATAKRAE
jgi:hypothetical protein